MTTNNLERLLDLDDVANLLNVSRYTVRRWAAEGKLPRVKLGRRTLFDPRDVQTLVAQGREQSVAQKEIPSDE